MTPLGSTPRSFVRARGSDLGRGHGRKLRSYVFSRNGPDDEAIKPELENSVLYYTEAWRLSRYGDLFRAIHSARNKQEAMCRRAKVGANSASISSRPRLNLGFVSRDTTAARLPSRCRKLLTFRNAREWKPWRPSAVGSADEYAKGGRRLQDAQSRNCPFTFYAMQMKGSARHL